MKHPSDNARDVCEYLLERTRQALLTGDDKDLFTLFTLPQTLQTFDGQRLITTKAELRLVFHSVSTHYRKIGVTDIVRHCIEADFQTPDTIVSTHETRLVNGNVMVQKPFPVLSILKFNGDVWQIASSSYAIEDRPDHNAALMSAGVPIPSKTVH